MTLITLIRVIFLISLGVELLVSNPVCRILAGVSALILGGLVLTGRL